MADEQHAGEQQTQQDDKYNPATVDDAKKIIESLQKRLGERDQTIDGLKKSNGDLDGRLKQIEVAQRKQLEQDGNFKLLAEQHGAEVARLKPIEERAAALEKIIRESNDARIQAVPEQMRALIPSDYPPEKLQTWLNANASLLAKQPAPDYDAGKGVGGGSGSAVKLTPEELAVAKRMGVTPEEFAKVKARRQA